MEAYKKQNKMEIIRLIKKAIRKRRHIIYLHDRINELHHSIFSRAMDGVNPVINDAALLTKYNRRLKLIRY